MSCACIFLQFREGVTPTRKFVHKMSTSRLAYSLSATTTATTAWATLMRRWPLHKHCDLNTSLLTASLSQRRYYISITAVSRANASSSRGGGTGIPGEPRKSSTRLTKRSAASSPITSTTSTTKTALQDDQTAAAAAASAPPSSSQSVATTAEITEEGASAPPHQTMSVSKEDRQQKVNKKESEVINTSSLDSSDPRATPTATTIDQLRTALVHLTRRTTSLATDIGDLRHLVTEANTSSRVAAMTSTTSQNAIDDLNVTIQRLEGLLEQCERSASQSALRWERLDVSSGTGSNLTHSAALADAAGSVVPTSSSSATTSSASSNAVSHLAATLHASRNADDNIPPPPLASPQQPLRSTNDESSTVTRAVHHVGGVEDSRQPNAATQRTTEDNRPNVTTQYLLSRIEMLSSTVASLVQQQQRFGHQQMATSALPPPSAGAEPGPPLQLAPSSVVAISATLCPTTNLLTVAGSQVVVSNIPAVVSASAIRTWCYAVGPVLSIIVLPQSRKNRTLQQHRASTTTGSSSPQASGTDVKSMLVTFATVEDANRAVQRLHGYAWAGSSLQSPPPQQQGHGDKTFFNRQHFVLSVELFQQHDAAAAAALALIPISLTTTTAAAATLQ
ncbi:GPI-anchored surface protein, putative [Bodo saltans]|uniref:GPI-anchored surface protein, putative n=1 Tax=Bodo saltans TaxID=75058 RepID=A0A0S4J4U5_BODSA|nr:GPI-anchored surface protein, putative [Bodo saltans]|eukprot:CUG86433.1 GPI-anchored surface protein, putative [Bodo saltans]